MSTLSAVTFVALDGMNQNSIYNEWWKEKLRRFADRFLVWL